MRISIVPNRPNAERNKAGFVGHLVSAHKAYNQNKKATEIRRPALNCYYCSVGIGNNLKSHEEWRRTRSWRVGLQERPRGYFLIDEFASVRIAVQASLTEFPSSRVDLLSIASPSRRNTATLLSFLRAPLPPSWSSVTA